MRILFKAVLLAGGLCLVLWSIKPLTLLWFGRKADGVITQVKGSDATTEMQGGRRSVAKPTGYFKVKVPVTYTFDILPTPLEALERLSDAPIATGVTGSDTLYGKTKNADIPMWMKGDDIRVLYLKSMPSFNAAYQPRSMTALGTFRLMGGVILLAWGILFRRVKRVVPPEEREAAEHLIEG